MKREIHFGFSSINYRSDSGALLGKELERIYDFLRQHGIVIADCFDSQIVFCHPDLYDSLKDAINSLGLYPLIIASNLHFLRESENHSIAEGRVMEALCPCSLILEDATGSNQKHLPFSIPDSFDLRDISCMYNGVLKVFYDKEGNGLNNLLAQLNDLDLNKYGFSRVGILNSPNYDGDYPPSKATIVCVESPGKIICRTLGDIDVESIKTASNSTSIWEIGEWT